MFNNRTRGLAVTVFSMTVFTGLVKLLFNVSLSGNPSLGLVEFLGGFSFLTGLRIHFTNSQIRNRPLLAPFIGGFTVINKNLGWRWTEYFAAIMGLLALGLNLVFLEDTYPPVVLVEKASELRRATQKLGIHAKQEEIEVDFKEFVSKSFGRPLRLLFTEPIIFLLSICMAFIYGLLYLFLAAYPIVFQEIHGMNEDIGGLPYFGMVFGMLLAGAYFVFTQKSYAKKLAANHGVTVPEWRLPPAIVGGCPLL